MVDWSKPVESDSYLDILDDVRARDEHVAALDYTGDTNVPTNVVRYNTSTNKFQRHAGSGTYNNLAFHTAIDTHIADTALHEGMKTGDLKMIAYNPAPVPTGWLLCNGVTYNISSYADLYAKIGTTYGGDGVTTFAVPNFQLKMPIGVDGVNTTLGGSYGSFNHTHTTPDHTHTVSAHAHSLNGHTHTVGAHTHPVAAHNHSIPAHGHATTHSYANINVTSSGSHNHTGNGKGAESGTTPIERFRLTGTGGTNYAYTVSSNSSNHVHSHGAFAGTVGAWDGAATGVSGDSAMISGSNTAGTTAESNGTFNTGPAAGNTANSTAFQTPASEGGSITGTANPPCLAIYFLIKT